VDQLDDVLEGLRAFLRDEVASRHRDNPVLADAGAMYGPDGRYVEPVRDLIREVREASAKAGYYTMLVPADLGGGGLGFEALLRAWESVYHWCGGERWLGYYVLSHWARGPSQVLRHATPELRDALLPALLDGRESLCFAMSEPDAGSDAWRMRTTATETGDGYVLNGTKQWITNGPYADHVLVFAVTDPEAAANKKGGVTAFLLPMDAPGLRVDSVIRMFGHAGGDEAIISFTDVVATRDRVIGEVGRGFPLALSGVSTGRIYNSGRAVGLARWALETALAYANERTAFGKPIIDNQGVSFPLVDRYMEIKAAWLVALDTAKKLDAGDATPADVAMSKAFATEAAVRAVDTAVQAHGAMGFTNELGLAEAWQQVRRICVADGTSEILRRSIVSSLRKTGPRW
jgi:alkylation response protein AidB-like acyl-CoA dehydrogenase